jgi:hypothetical protein
MIRPRTCANLNHSSRFAWGDGGDKSGRHLASGRFKHPAEKRARLGGGVSVATAAGSAAGVLVNLRGRDSD